jgi:hypothetical protein
MPTDPMSVYTDASVMLSPYTATRYGTPHSPITVIVVPLPAKNTSDSSHWSGSASSARSCARTPTESTRRWSVGASPRRTTTQIATATAAAATAASSKLRVTPTVPTSTASGVAALIAPMPETPAVIPATVANRLGGTTMRHSAGWR